MPLFEYECDKCMDRYNRDIDSLAAKLNKTNASKIHASNKGIEYIEVSDPKTKKSKFDIGEKGERNVRRFKWTINKNNVLYMELRNFRFSELIYDKEEEKKLKCPVCGKKSGVRRVFSTFKAIFDDKSKREPRPGDDLQFHMDYKVQKDEERASNWVGQDHLNQYFNR